MVKWSCGAVATAYGHLIQEHYSWLVNSPAGRKQQAGVQGSQNDVVVKFRDWMRENYTSCKEQLLTLLAHESRDVQVTFRLSRDPKIVVVLFIGSSSEFSSIADQD